MKVTAETLKLIEVFEDLDKDDRHRLAATIGAKRYAPKSQIITQDDSSSGVFFVVSGRVRATVYARSGKEVAFQDLGAGEMFGELAAIDGQPRSTHVVALDESLIASMSGDAFWSALMSNPSVARRTLLRLTGLIRRHSERIVEYGTLGVKNRIHAELLRLARCSSQDDGEVEIPNPPTHAEIASRVATHREAVTRECKHLEEQGLIEWRPGRHAIRDVAALARMVEQVRGH